MQANVLWTGREYYSLENCVIQSTMTGSEIRSVIVGRYGDKIYRVDYEIAVDHDWKTKSFKLQSRYGDTIIDTFFESDGAGNWKRDGESSEEFRSCMDVDLVVTPFTNTLPIKRLNLKIGDSKKIKLIYFDILENQIRVAEQLYRRISDAQYHYENIPNDFEADITVDEDQLVVDYPELFVRS